jgi:hypothetical protein
MNQPPREAALDQPPQGSTPFFRPACGRPPPTLPSWSRDTGAYARRPRIGQTGCCPTPTSCFAAGKTPE